MTHEVTTPCPVCGRPFPGLDLIPGRKAPAAVPREVDQLFPLVDVGHNKGLVSRLWLARQRASDLRRVAEMLETALRGIQTTRKGDGSMLSLGETMTLFGRIADQLRAMSEVQ